MSEVFLTSPKLSDEGRELFEKKYAEGDKVVTSLMRVDTTLRKARTHASDEELTQLECITEAHLAEALASAPYEKGVDVIDYFHLRIKHALIKQLVYAHSAFSQRDKFELRRELVDGIYGGIAEVLEEALSIYDNSSSEHERLTGVISELTALALLNRRQAPERLAIPSDVTADLYNATDLEYFTFTKDKAKSTIYHIQVKTSDKKSKKVHMPLGGILVTASSMLNTPDGKTAFPTSRALVAEVNAVDSPEQASHVQRAVQLFDDHMRKGTEKADRVYEIIQNMPPEILNGAMKAVHNIIDRAFKENPGATQIIFELPKDT